MNDNGSRVEPNLRDHELHEASTTHVIQAGMIIGDTDGNVWYVLPEGESWHPNFPLLCLQGSQAGTQQTTETINDGAIKIIDRNVSPRSIFEAL